MQPGRAPKIAQGGNQMGGMMMGGGQVPNPKKLDPEDRVRVQSGKATPWSGSDGSRTLE